jgi:hypothetical protein
VEGVDSALRFSLLALMTFSGIEPTPLDGFGLFAGVSFGWGHGALLDTVWVFGDCSLPTCT